MFEFLTKMFGKAVDVEVVGYQPPEVEFTSAEPLPLGINDVHASISGVQLKARVQIVETGTEISKGFWLAPIEAIPYLEEIFAHSEKRKVPRYARRLRVRSPQLESFQGHSLDLSMEGLRLEGQGLLTPGSTIAIEVDIDDNRQTQLRQQVLVRWTAPSVQDGFMLAGLEFVEFDARSEDFIHYAKFLERLAISEKPLAEQ